jgi:hypothetical protein
MTASDTQLLSADHMRNWSLRIRRRLVLSTFCEAPETGARKRAEVAPEANDKRVSGRNLCR